MIILYYEPGNSSCKKAIDWFQNKNISLLKKKIDSLSREDLMYALKISDDGFASILKRNSKSSIKSKKIIEDIEEMKFYDSINLILKHTELIRTPFIIGENKIMTGFNSEEIRRFIPRVYRH
ncbi:ArsC/Spx/MgsR family protein [Lactococcus formosensis]|uniref:ArsC/Spx/MgsR family protein n=1 Tax=Lactococcus formosensis TaxID=1281486 RepID=UPI0039F6E879